MRLNVEQMENIVWKVGGSQTDPGLRKLRLDLIVDAFENFMENGTGFAYGELGGFLLAMHSVDVFSGKRKAYEFLFLVDEHKQPETASRLLAEFEAGAKADGCETAVTGAHAGFADWKKVDRFYRMKGYSFLSESMQKIL